MCNHHNATLTKLTQLLRMLGSRSRPGVAVSVVYSCAAVVLTTAAAVEQGAGTSCADNSHQL